VNPGETVDLGIVLLTEYGILAGTVVNAADGLPIANATVGGCPVDPLLPCDAPTSTGLSGTFSITSPPGGVNLVVTSPGFLPGYLRADAVSGTTVNLPVITIAPVTNESIVTVSGDVKTASLPAVPISDATLTLWSGPSIAASVDASALGVFSLSVPTGAYTLEATAPGYAPAIRSLDLTEPVAGLELSLATFGWSVTGTVRDGLTNATVAGVAIWSPEGLVAVTDAAGVFSAALPNGTYNLTAVAGGVDASMYAPVGFEVQVAAASVARAVWLFPASETLVGTVESSVNGSAIPGAEVTVTGTAVDGAARTISAVTDSGGRFSIPFVYDGSYTVTVTAPGYHGATTAISAGVANAPLQFALGPTQAPASGPTLAAWSYTFLALAVVGAVVVAVAWLSRRQRGAA
jgi:hypothetical protein